MLKGIEYAILQSKDDVLNISNSDMTHRGCHDKLCTKSNVQVSSLTLNENIQCTWKVWLNSQWSLGGLVLFYSSSAFGVFLH